MNKPAWSIIIGIISILFGIANVFSASVDLSQVRAWESLNQIFAPARQAIGEQGFGEANLALGMIAPPAWFIRTAVVIGWVSIAIGVLFAAGGVGLILYRRFGMRLLAAALAANIAVQVFYSAEAVRSLSVQAVVIPARAFWVVGFNLLLLLVIGIGSLRWFRFARAAETKV